MALTTWACSMVIEAITKGVLAVLAILRTFLRKSMSENLRRPHSTLIKLMSLCLYCGDVFDDYDFNDASALFYTLKNTYKEPQIAV